MTCLLHRTGLKDRSWQDFLRGMDDEDFAGEQEPSSSLNEYRANRIFTTLLRKVVTGSTTGRRQMQVPTSVDCGRLQSIIREEFRQEIINDYDLSVRREVAFRALRELHKKCAYIHAQNPLSIHPQQAARNVKALPLQPPSSFLQPGAFLVAHPLLTGYFHRSVICILDHAASDSSNPKSYETYGLVVNRNPFMTNGRPLTVTEILQPSSLPDTLLDLMAGSTVHEGGPVCYSLQMLHASAQEPLDGSVLPTLGDPETTTALESDKAVYYHGNLEQAAQAVKAGTLDRDEDVAMFVGCSMWSEGQLENEVERGVWIPCAAPSRFALTGICDHHEAGTNDRNGRPIANLWLSMMSALGEEERELAHWLIWDDGNDENGDACDQTYE